MISRVWREFGVVFLTLALLAAVYITSDVRQQREHMLSLHEQKAKALLISMEASLEAGMMASANLADLSTLLGASPDFQDIGYIVLWSDNTPYLLYPPPTPTSTPAGGGEASGEAGGAGEGVTVPALKSADGRPLPVDPNQFSVRVVDWRGATILEVTKPVAFVHGWHRMMGLGMGSMEQWGGDGRGAGPGAGADGSGAAPGYLAAGLKLANVEEMVAGDVWRSVLIGLLILVAGGLVLFLLVAQEKNLLTRRLLASTETLTRSILGNVANGVIALDERGVVVAFNREADRITGLDATDAIGRSLAQLVPAGWEPGRLLRDTLKTGEAHLEVEPPSGRRGAAEKWDMPVVVSTTPLPSQASRAGSTPAAARTAGAVAILRDVTRLKELEEDLRRRERLAALGRLSAGLAHEIRNPLGAIKGIAQFLRRELPAGDDRAEDLDVIVRESNRLNRLVQDILTYARESQPRLEPVQMGGIVKEAASLVRAHRGAVGDVLRLPELLMDDCSAAERGGAVLVADREQLKQVLINLLENALDAVESLGPAGEVEVGCLGCGATGFFVSDNGPGVPPAERGRVFDPFYTTKEAGTGLGLAIAHRLVANHGGRLEVVDGPKGGARFEVRLPLHPDRAHRVDAACGADAADGAGGAAHPLGDDAVEEGGDTTVVADSRG